jgi:hypothetical protein
LFHLIAYSQSGEPAVKLLAEDLRVLAWSNWSVAGSITETCSQ